MEFIGEVPENTKFKLVKKLIGESTKNNTWLIFNEHLAPLKLLKMYLTQQGTAVIKGQFIGLLSGTTETYFKRCCYILQGELTSTNKSELLEKTARTPLILLCTTSTGGVGLNLTQFNNVSSF
jgi:hypothetical protein